MQSRIRVDLDDETLRHLQELAAKERRPTAEQAAVLIERALARRLSREQRAAARETVDARQAPRS